MKKVLLKIILIPTILLLIVLNSHVSKASGSVIGNGGDPLLHFLEVSRRALIETLISLENNASEKEKLCASSQHPSFCRELHNEVHMKITAINKSPQRTEFALSDLPLWVEGPYGEPMMVAAQTLLGPTGPIEFHRGSIQTMAPAQVLHLLTHEFLHKVQFRGEYISDNQKLGPYLYGRIVIDEYADEIAQAALRLRKIGRQFGIMDRFECRFLKNAREEGLRLSTPTPRWFLSTDLTQYQTSLSLNPSDATVEWPETLDTVLKFQLTISEDQGCQGASSVRSTQLRVIRNYFSQNRVVREELLQETTLPGLNPMCQPSTDWLSLSQGPIEFRCRFLFSTAVAN